MKKLLFMLFVLIYLSAISSAKAQNLARSTSDSQISASSVLQKFVQDKVVEKISYDESHRNYVRFPNGFDVKKMSYLDMYPAQTTVENVHIDEFLTSKGTYVKVITYLNEENMGEAWAIRPKFRAFLPDKIIALDADLNVLRELENFVELKSEMQKKGKTALASGLFQEPAFQEMSLESIAGFEKEGFKFSIEGSDYLLKKDEGFFVYNSKDLYLGGKRKEGEKWVQRVNFFQESSNGYVVPKNTQAIYDDVLPTGIKVTRAEYVITSNFQVEGDRYKSKLASPSVITSSILRVVPNPVSDVLRCQTSLFSSSSNEAINVNIVDIMGKVLLNANDLVGGNIFEVNVSNLANGVYILNLRKGNQTQSTKFIKN